MSCQHPKPRLYKHGTLAMCSICGQQNPRIQHNADGTWVAVGKWAIPKQPFKESRWTMREARRLQVAHG